MSETPGPVLDAPWRPPWRMLCPVCTTHWLTVSPAQPLAECPGGHLTACYDPATERITLTCHAAPPPTFDIRIDSPTSALVAGVRDGLCLICRKKPVRFCGLWCAVDGDSAPTDPACITCRKHPALYCSRACASRGR